MPNPFHASFGVSPPLLVGREVVLEEFDEALEDGPGSAGRATLFTGSRGAGKTVMLNAVEDLARPDERKKRIAATNTSHTQDSPDA